MPTKCHDMKTTKFIGFPKSRREQRVGVIPNLNHETKNK